MSSLFTDQKFVEIEKDKLTEKIQEMYDGGYGLSMISVHYKGVLALIYSFEKNYELVNIRAEISADDEIESVCKLYPHSYVYENEVKELYGVKINNMDVDFKGNLYRKAVKTPFAPKDEVK